MKLLFALYMLYNCFNIIKGDLCDMAQMEAAIY